VHLELFALKYVCGMLMQQIGHLKVAGLILAIL